MLVPAMNNKEITAEIIKDGERITLSTIPRLMAEYDKERKRKKIDKKDEYLKEYSIKTHAKNNWILFLRKKITVDSYKGMNDIGGHGFTYYYSELGLRFFGLDNKKNPILVYNSHFFRRYNERMYLNMHDIMEIAKHYIGNNIRIRTGIKIINGEEHMMSLLEEGIALGRYNDECNWIIYNTFISNDLQRDDQQSDIAVLQTKFEIEKLEAAKQTAIYNYPAGTLLRPAWR